MQVAIIAASFGLDVEDDPAQTLPLPTLAVAETSESGLPWASRSVAGSPGRVILKPL